MTTAALAILGTLAAILAAVLLLAATLKSGRVSEVRDGVAKSERAEIRTQLHEGLGDVRIAMQNGLAASNTDREAIRTELRDVRTEISVVQRGVNTILQRLGDEPAGTASDQTPTPAGAASPTFPLAAKPPRDD